ncbi:MAG: hypothetical protein AB1757_03840 [Acidobacteriota bacterium]
MSEETNVAVLEDVEADEAKESKAETVNEKPQDAQPFVERRQSFEERRKLDMGPPPGFTERRVINQRLFDRRNQGTVTGELLVEVGRFAAENMAFRQKMNKAAARRARKHLSMIMKLAKQRRAEISAEMKSLGGTSEPDDDTDD